jgi:hypothetical protein
MGKVNPHIKKGPVPILKDKNNFQNLPFDIKLISM